MENVISARRLRKKVLNSSGEVDLNLYNLDKKKSYNCKVSKTKNKDIKIINFKTKILIKIFLCSFILFSIVLSKLFFINNIKEHNSIVKYYKHYTTDYSKKDFINKVEYNIKKVNLLIGNIVPDELKQYVKNKYFIIIKPYILTFNLKNEFNDLISFKKNNNKYEISEKTNDKDIENLELELNNKTNEIKETNDVDKEIFDGKGGAEPLENKTEEVFSSISIMDTDVEFVKSKEISIISPVNGVITSRYGIREVVFEGVNPYHTGIDIANKEGTEILSATNGVVTKVEFNNKYYGNYIEITENEVTFKYAHLKTINVKQGDNISQKSIIGLMGSTGMSTGPHLHFEIKVNDRTINPELLVKF